MAQCELQVFFSGRVQGIGFRWTLVDHAEKLELVGTAKNLPDGRVEVVAQGEKETLEAFLEAVQSDPGLARIEKIETVFSSPEKSFPSFTIIQ